MPDLIAAGIASIPAVAVGIFAMLPLSGSMTYDQYFAWVLLGGSALAVWAGLGRVIAHFTTLKYIDFGAKWAALLAAGYVLLVGAAKISAIAPPPPL